MSKEKLEVTINPEKKVSFLEAVMNGKNREVGFLIIGLFFGISLAFIISLVFFTPSTVIDFDSAQSYAMLQLANLMIVKLLGLLVWCLVFIAFSVKYLPSNHLEITRQDNRKAFSHLED